jgi:hypothetical protein
MAAGPSEGAAADAAIGRSIMWKWRERTASTDGCFLFFHDGDRSNRDEANLESVPAYDCFRAMQDGHELVEQVDWNEGLSAEEEAFVRKNVWNFVQTYKPERDSHANDHFGLDEPSVAALAAQGDAAMESGDYEKAVQLYEAAKVERARLAPRAAPQHGRRSGQSPASSPVTGTSKDAGAKGSRRAPRDRPVVCVSTPSRRKVPEGAPSRKEEVAARVAARK